MVSQRIANPSRWLTVLQVQVLFSPFASIAQLVEHRTCNAAAGSSSLSWGICLTCLSV